MIDNILVNKLQLVKKENIDNFLKLYGWSIMKDFSNKNLTVYLKDNYTIVIPSNEHFTDFIPKLYEALKMVCEIENRLLDTIINEIISINIDNSLLDL